MTMRTSNAELIAQITHRKIDFVKPVAIYRLLSIFGQSIIGVEGSDWRRHKKIVGPSFSERSNKLVFEESSRQAMRMMAMWSSHPGNSKKVIKLGNTAPDTMKLSFHVICAAGFDFPQRWPNELTSKKEEIGSPLLTELSGTHTLTFKDSIDSVLQGLRLLALYPKWFLSAYPSSVVKESTR
jgi:cytochrome P450